jgi:hypothetical protein
MRNYRRTKSGSDRSEPRKRKAIIVAIATLSLVGAGVGTAAAILPGNQAPSPTPTVNATGPGDPPAAQAPATTIDPALRANFAVMLTRAAPDGALPESVMTSPLSREVGANAGLTRVARAPTGAPLYLIPDSNGLCLGDGTETSCSTTASAIAGQLFSVRLCGDVVPKGSVRLSGLIPDGADHVVVTVSATDTPSGGDAVTVPVTNNVYDANLGAPPIALDWSDDNGAHHLDVPAVPATTC